MNSLVARITALVAINSITDTDCSIITIETVTVATTAKIIVVPCHCITNQRFTQRNHFLGYFACCFTVIIAWQLHY